MGTILFYGIGAVLALLIVNERFPDLWKNLKAKLLPSGGGAVVLPGDDDPLIKSVRSWKVLHDSVTGDAKTKLDEIFPLLHNCKKQGD